MNEINYTLKKSKRARRMRLAVYGDGSVVVTAPVGMRESLVEKFVHEKREWLGRKISFFEKAKGHALSQYGMKEYLLYKKKAYVLAEARVQYFNEIYGYSTNKISIRNQKTRWGSCSKRGNLNFNYKIALLPPRMMDYIIVHELCHRKEFNHSKRFWDLVAKTIPDYREIRKDLRNYNFLIIDDSPTIS